ncbi:cytochrome c peroxidase [Hymenobacter saemangeumensis]|uniref:Cytochrome c peroxidase n=1 Tax=Hymenobacter saemangeumensis TaxID=1084522 RepID=A0ABP8IP89_9BACT
MLSTAWALAVGFFLLVACQKEEEGPVSAAATAGFSALPLSVPAPADNPSTLAKVALGRVLFWDPVLSGGKDVSCASCHHPAAGYADGLDLAVGVNGQGTGAARRFRSPNSIPFGPRNTPSVLNTAFNGMMADGSSQPSAAPMFWDNRALSLESQALGPLANFSEMRGHQYSEALALDSLVARLRGIAEYQRLFSAAFGGSTPITAGNLAKALACFERTLVSTDTPFDRYLRGDKTALSDEQVRGLNAFVQSGCNKCHSGPMLSDYQLHVLGVVDNEKNQVSDSGPNGSYAFRTPSLRNLAFTAPYMHSGKLPDLQAVLRFYDPGPGPRPPLNPNVAPNQRDPLLNVRVTDPQAIIAFLGALSSSSFDQTIPARVPSGLRVGGN